MIIPLPVEITKLIDVGIATLRDIKDPELLKESIERAQNFNDYFKYTLENIKSSGFDDQDINTLLERLSAFNNKRDELIKEIKSYLKNEIREKLYQSMMAFQQISTEIEITFMNLMKKLQEVPSYSSFPGIDDFIILMKQACEGTDNSEKLLNVLNFIKSTKDSLNKEIEFFIYIYPEEKTIYEEIKNSTLKLEKEIETLETIFQKSIDRESLIKSIENLVNSSRELYYETGKMEEIRRKNGHSHIKPLDNLIHTGIKFIENMADLSGFEYLFHSFKYTWISSLIELCKFENSNPIRTEIAKKYFPFIEEKTRVLKARMDAITGIIKSSLSSELIFREEPFFTPPGTGKFPILLQFIALSNTHLNSDIYITEKEILPEEKLNHLPLPKYEQPFKEQEDIAEEMQTISKTVTREQKSSPPVAVIKQSSGQNWLGQNVKLDIPQSNANPWKPQETKKGPEKKWDTKGFHTTSQSTESLIDAALKRLKEGK